MNDNHEAQDSLESSFLKSAGENISFEGILKAQES